jgi:vancomycin permeability regulator SanA
VALVLGCAGRAAGRSPMLAARCATAAREWHAGRARQLLLSGTPEETRAMRAFVGAHAIPADATRVDDGARRTLDNVARARQVFGLDEVLLVTSDFHLPRALFLARLVGLRATGVAAERPTRRALPWLREAVSWFIVPRDVWRQCHHS